MSDESRPTLRRKVRARLQVLPRPHALWGLVLWIAGGWLALASVCPAIGQWLAQRANIQSAGAIVILGGSMERLQRGIQIYHQGLAPELWHTGADPQPVPDTSFAQFVARRAIQEGVAPQAIHLLQTENTWQDGQQIAAYARQRQIDSLLIVTDWYHSRRALCVVRSQTQQLGITVYYAPATGTAYRPGNWWLKPAGWKAVVSEMLKIGYYGLRYRVFPWSCAT